MRSRQAPAVPSVGTHYMGDPTQDRRPSLLTAPRSPMKMGSYRGARLKSV